MTKILVDRRKPQGSAEANNEPLEFRVEREMTPADPGWAITKWSQKAQSFGGSVNRILLGAWQPKRGFNNSTQPDVVFLVSDGILYCVFKRESFDDREYLVQDTSWTPSVGEVVRLWGELRDLAVELEERIWGGGEQVFLARDVDDRKYTLLLRWDSSSQEFVDHDDDRYYAMKVSLDSEVTK